MRLIHKYLIKNNIFYLGICILSCLSIYLLVDIFDRLDNFLNKSVPFEIIIKYFLWKIPLIISQIFPLVFFITLIIQFTLMKKHREWEALEGGGIFIGNVILFLIFYSFFFSLIYLFFSQYVGVIATNKTNEIWDNLGKKKIRKNKIIKDFWFRKDKFIGHIWTLDTKKREGTHIEIYEIDPNFSNIKTAFLAKKVKILKDKLVLSKVLLSRPNEFFVENRNSFVIYDKDMDVILNITSKDIESIPLWKLRGLIKELKVTGTNVESITTVWYSKISYSLSLIVLGILSVYIGRKCENLPVNLAISLVITFLFYGLFVVGTILGKHGIVPPLVGAFGVHIIFVLFLVFIYVSNREAMFM
ncbi:LptF/LptG family permease [Desulfothermus naphthae]